MPRAPVFLFVIAVIAAGAAAMAPAGAEAGHQGKNCGVISVANHDYRVHATSMRCKTARRASAKYLRRGQSRPGFDCAPTGGHSFYCQDPPKAYWAIRQ